MNWITKRGAIVLAFLSAVAVPVTAGATTPPAVPSVGMHWAWQNPLPQGNDLGDVNCPAASVCYATGAQGSVLKTTDGGTSWVAEPIGLGAAGPISCPSPLECYLGSGNLLLHTVDGGRSWASRLSPITPQFPVIATITGLSCPSSTTCFGVVGTGSSHPGPSYIIATIDRGTDWSNQTPNGAGQLGSIDCPSLTTCYASGAFGSVLATKDGITWNPQPTGVNVDLGQVSCVGQNFCAIADAAPGAITSTNGGTTWTAHTPSNAISASGGVSGMSCSSTMMCVATGMDNAGTPNMLAIVSVDGGSSWAVSYPPTVPGWLNSVSCPTTSMCVAVGRHGWIAVTHDGGASWSSPSSGPANPLRAVSCPTQQACFAAGDAGIMLATTNGGRNWAAQQTGTTSSLRGVSCADASNCMAVGLSGTMIQTTDGGAQWSSLNTMTTDDLLSVSCPSVSHCVAVGQASKVLVADGGAVQASSASPYTINGVSCLDASTCYLGGGYDAFTRNAAIQLSSDGGRNWTSQQSNDPQDIQAISCTPGTTACSAVDNAGNLLSSTDGSTWSLHSVAPNNWLDAVSCPMAGRCLTVSTSAGMISTGDGGATSQSLTPITGNGLFGVSCPKVGVCTVVGDQGTILATARPRAAPSATIHITQPTTMLAQPATSASPALTARSAVWPALQSSPAIDTRTWSSILPQLVELVFGQLGGLTATSVRCAGATRPNPKATQYQCR